jgi:C-methyltransferase
VSQFVLSPAAQSDLEQIWDYTCARWKAQQILTTIRAATRPGTTVLLVECVIPADDRDFVAKWTDLEMLVSNAGRERTGDEYQNLLQQADFHITRIVPTASPLSIVEATAA